MTTQSSLKSDFIAGKLDLKDTFATPDCSYELYTSYIPQSLSETLIPGTKMSATYVKPEDDASDAPKHLIFIWETNDYKQIVPFDVICVNELYTLLEKTYTTDDKDFIVGDKMILGNDCDVTIVHFNQHNPIRAKVDTGAGQCCIHGTDLKTGDGLVAFTFNGRRYKMLAVDSQIIRTADGGDSNRPCVNFTVKIGDQIIDNVTFNINDRTEMPFKILLGQNLLSQGRFIIDPTYKDKHKQQKIINDYLSHYDVMSQAHIRLLSEDDIKYNIITNLVNGHNQTDEQPK